MFEINLWSLLACAGITHFLVQSDAAEFIRKILSRLNLLKRMLQCAFCTGFWVSILLGCGLLIPPKYLILFAFAGALVSTLVDHILLAAEATINTYVLLAQHDSTTDEVIVSDDKV